MPRKPSNVIQFPTAESMPENDPPSNGGVAKRTHNTKVLGFKPCLYVLDGHVETLAHSFSNGRSVRNLAIQYGVGVADIEERLRWAYRKATRKAAA